MTQLGIGHVIPDRLLDKVSAAVGTKHFDDSVLVKSDGPGSHVPVAGNLLYSKLSATPFLEPCHFMPE